MKRIKKHHVQLLEVIIAMFLILCFAVPVIQSYTFTLHSRKDFEQTIQLDHAIHLIHATIVEKLYTYGSLGEPLQSVLDKDWKASDLNIISLKEMKVPYEISYKMVKVKSKESKDNGENCLLKIIIKAEGKDKKITEFDYSAFVFLDPRKQTSVPDSQAENLLENRKW